MPSPRLFPTFVLLTLMACGPALAQQQGFKFSQPDDSERQEQQAKEERIRQQLSTPCRAAIKDRKIMVLIGERQSNGYIAAQQQNYGPHFNAINNRLRTLGLKTYTPEEIRRQIAQAEIDAYLKNDQEAMLSAAKRLGASFVLRGLISSQAMKNPMMNVNQVDVNMQFTLSGNGQIISETDAHSASYAGADVTRMALTLVNEQADEVVATLYEDYCRKVGAAMKKPTQK
jgi:acid stress-induced BolA-like protein IbaG/YrbA